MVTLAKLYRMLDLPIEQLAAGLVILTLLLALAWYVSHPIHRRRLSAAIPRSGVRVADDRKLKRAA
jgi:hypothetical protein